ncbi:MAG: hypothetical protein RLZZ165_1301 [Bacteroidota bacterium]|jgi:hypothetical protein
MKHWLFLLLWPLLLLGDIAAQQIQIGVNAKEITTDDQFVLSVTLSGITGGQVPQPRFPEIKGLQMGGTSTSQSWVNGYASVTFSRTYFAPSAGKFVVPEVSYEFRGAVGKSPAFTLIVKKGTGRQQPNNASGGMRDPFGGMRDPFGDFFSDPFFGGGGRQRQPEDMKFKSLSADYFLSVNLDKSSCYIGEQVHGDVVLYVNELDARKIKVDGQAIMEMQQRIKNNGFWQEIIELKEIPAERTRVNGKNYIAYTLYKNILFPIKTGDIEFKDIYLDGMKLAVATNADPISRFLGQDIKFEAIKIRASDRKLIVKPLPPTALPDANMVGKFKMEASLNHPEIRTGQNLELEVKIAGNGNMAMITDPAVAFPENFEVYDPSTTYNSRIQGNGIIGDKSWKWSMLPTRAGSYDLGPLKFFYFDPESGHYDSLVVPEIKVKVTGDDIENQRIGKSGIDTYYVNAFSASESAPSSNESASAWVLFGGLTLVAGLVAMVVIRRRKEKQNPLANDSPRENFWKN